MENAHMIKNKKFFLLLASVVVNFVFVCAVLGAQEQSLAEIKYQEDYDRMQKIIKVSDPAKRADQIATFYQQRPDMDQRVSSYIDGFFMKDLEALYAKQSFAILIGVNERALKARPLFAEAYFYQGMALQNLKKSEEAISAFAKCSVMRNPKQDQAKKQLDLVYKAVHGNLVGEQKVITLAMRDLRK
jgi:tetratricopeptide (TPR) repeat protein